METNIYISSISIDFVIFFHKFFDFCSRQNELVNCSDNKFPKLITIFAIMVEVPDKKKNNLEINPFKLASYSIKF